MAKSPKTTTAVSKNDDLLTAPPPVFDVNRELLKGLVSSFYQIQKVRIQIGNKLVAHFYRKLGIDASKKMLEEAQGDRKASLDMIDLLRLEYKRVADAVASKDEITQAKFNKLATADRGVFSEYVELSWMQSYRRSLNSENSVLRDIELTLEKFPIWNKFLVGIKGVGPTIGGVMVAFIDIHKAQTPASIWAYCFPAGTLISTMNGMVPIDMLSKGDRVLDASGIETQVLDTMTRKFTGDMVTLKAIGTMPLTLSDEHPLVVSRNGTKVWLKAQDVVPGDKLFIPTLLDRGPMITWWQDVPDRAHRKTNLFGEPVEITPDFLYLCGRFVGDGHATLYEEGIYKRGRCGISFGHHESDALDYCKTIADGIFGGANSFRMSHTFNMQFGRLTVAKNFQRWFGHMAHNKKIPDFIMGLVYEDQITAFLRGYFDADGHSVKAGKSANTILASSASVGLILQLQLLLSKVGVFGSVHNQKRGGDGTTTIYGKTINQRDDRYVLSVPASSADIIYEDCDLSQMGLTRRKIERVFGGGWLLTVSEVKKEAVVDVPVYNLHTATNTYLAQNLAVHNCGLDVVPTDRFGKEDGRGRGRYKGHLVERGYEDREGNQGVRDSITFNPIIKTKLVGLLAEIMVKHRTPIYRDEYDNYKLRITQREDLRENAAKAAGDTTFTRRSKLHINRMAYRYMIKRFLVHYYIKARTLEGLEVVPEYSIAKLGMVHHTPQGQWSKRASQGHQTSDDDDDTGYPSLIAEEQTPPPLL